MKHDPIDYERDPMSEGSVSEGLAEMIRQHEQEREAFAFLGDLLTPSERPTVRQFNDAPTIDSNKAFGAWVREQDIMGERDALILVTFDDRAEPSDSYAAPYRAVRLPLKANAADVVQAFNENKGRSIAGGPNHGLHTVATLAPAESKTRVPVKQFRAIMDGLRAAGGKVISTYGVMPDGTLVDPLVRF